MNISLAPQKKKAKKGSLGFGLNSRNNNTGEVTTTTTTTKASNRNVFGGSDEDEDDEDEGLSARDRVNLQISKEQAALRKRAQAAVAAVGDPSVYDYDGAYDSFKETSALDTKKSNQEPDERKSKYIGDLLKAAKKRERERDTINERKIAREQAEEDAKEEYQGKEKFITKAYKRKLEERKQWQAEEEQRQEKEDADDVTKKTGGTAMADFYGNFNRNVAMGGRETQENVEEEEGKDLDENGYSHAGGMGFLAGFARSDDPIAPEPENEATEKKQEQTTEILSGDEEKLEPKTLSMREIREKKVAEARIRYLERKRLALQ